MALVLDARVMDALAALRMQPFGSRLRDATPAAVMCPEEMLAALHFLGAWPDPPSGEGTGPDDSSEEAGGEESENSPKRRRTEGRDAQEIVAGPGYAAQTLPPVQQVVAAVLADPLMRARLAVLIALHRTGFHVAAAHAYGADFACYAGAQRDEWSCCPEPLTRSRCSSPAGATCLFAGSRCARS